MNVVYVVKKEKAIEKWTSRDFIKYYFNKLKSLKNINTQAIPSEAWVGYGARIKGFIKKKNLSNFQYKSFIDSIFKNFYNSEIHVPAFGCIVSEKIFEITESFEKNRYSNRDFERLKEKLYTDNILFKNIELDLSE